MSVDPPGWAAVPPPPPRRRRWPAVLVAVLVLAITAAGLVAVTRRDPGRDVAQTPSPSPTPSPTGAETAAPPPTAPGTSSPELEALADQVASVRGLPLPGPLDLRLVEEAVLADRLSELIEEELDVAELERARRMSVALRLLPPDLDLLATLHALYREQVIGLYVPEDDVLYVRAADRELTPFERTTAAHEVVHALQDAAFDLEAMQDLDPVEADQSLAVAALTEGDATLTQQLWSLRFQTDEERAQAAREGMGVTSDVFETAPRYLQTSLIFPYVHGPAFVEALLEQGGFAALDNALANPPTTTAQILHPERYFAGQGAVPVVLPDGPGAGWNPAQEYTFGEFDVIELFAVLGDATATELGAGWAGGRVASWERGADTAVAVALGFDTPQDADAVCRRLPEWFAAVAGGAPAGEGLMQGPDDWLALSCDLPNVHFGIAPDEATARALATP